MGADTRFIKPIETYYKGYRFRSRLEARYAVFFDALGTPYEYEKEGYDLGDAGWYLPDFWLPSVTERNNPKPGLWVEIKPQNPTREEDARCDRLALGTLFPVYLAVGLPSEEMEGYEYVPTPPPESVLFYAELKKNALLLERDGDLLRIQMPKGVMNDTLRQRLIEHKQDILEMLDNNYPVETGVLVNWDNCMGLCQCHNPHCRHIKLEFAEGNYMYCPKCNSVSNPASPWLTVAYAAARAARFEHRA